MVTGLKQRIHALENRVVPPKLQILLIKEHDNAETMQAKHRKATGWDGDYITVRLVKPKHRAVDYSETSHAH